MKKILKGLAVATLVFGGLNADSAKTEKTFLMPRSHGVDAAMENSASWRTLLMTKGEDKFGAHFQVVPFYKDSTDDDDLGRYFGVKNKHLFQIGGTTGKDLDAGYIIHNVTDQTSDVAKIKFEPEQTAYGATIYYHQDLDKLLKGLFFKVLLPIVHVENDMHLGISKVDAADNVENMKKYFRGEYEGSGENKQVKLTHAKIDGDQDETGIADIDLVIGYKVINKDDVKLGLNIGLTIPTGNEADGKFLWEPIYGNGQHWGLGGGVDLCARVWEDGDQSFRIDAVANYRYLFESEEVRTLRLKDVPFSQYALVGVMDNATNLKNGGDIKLIPLANVLTKKVDVEPGSQLDAILNLAYCNGGFTVNLGYNLFWKSDEDVDLKEKWDETKYGLAKVDFKTAAGDKNAAELVIKRESIDVAAAETPSYVTHKLFGGVGYTFKEWDTPLMFGLGASYEFACDNNEVEGWGLWLKAGVAF